MFYKKFPIFTKFRVINPYKNEGDAHSFSTELETIGVKNDVTIANGAYVDVISDPVVINRPKYGGDISVIKVQADVAIDYHTIIKEFWVPSQFIVKVNESVSQNSN